MSDTTIVVLVLAAGFSSLGVASAFLVWMVGKMAAALGVVLEKQSGLVDRLADKAVCPDQGARISGESDAKEAYVRGYAAAVDKLTARTPSVPETPPAPMGYSMASPVSEDHLS